MRRLSRKQRLVGGAVTLLVLAVAGLVYAAWTTTGGGSGYAQAGTVQDLSTIDVSANVGTLPNKLYPGTTGDVLIQIHNPNPFPVTVTDVTAGSGSVTADTGHSSCTTTGVSFIDQSPLATPIAVPANGNSAERTLTNAAQMSNVSQNACQGATFTIPVDLAGTS
jgi:hypothetical protein